MKTPTRRGLRFRLTALALCSTLLHGCLATELSVGYATGEPKEVTVVLSTSSDAYRVTRWWRDSAPREHTLVVPKQQLPDSCTTAHFFLGEMAQPLTIAQPTSIPWVTAARPPLPDTSYPPCSLLVAYGAFAEPEPFEGLVVSSSAGPVATAVRRQPQPLGCVALPVMLVLDIYLAIAAIVTLPVWGSVGLAVEHVRTRQERNAIRALPPPVQACRDALPDKPSQARVQHNRNLAIVSLSWTPGQEHGFELIPANRPLFATTAEPIDTRVLLHNGRIDLDYREYGHLQTAGEIECGMWNGVVIVTGYRLYD